MYRSYSLQRRLALWRHLVSGGSVSCLHCGARRRSVGGGPGARPISAARPDSPDVLGGNGRARLGQGDGRTGGGARRRAASR